MESLFLAIISIFIIGLVSYLMGYFMISSKWKKKYKHLNRSYSNLENNYNRHQGVYKRGIENHEQLENSYIKLKNDRDLCRKKIEELESANYQLEEKYRAANSSTFQNEYLTLKKENQRKQDQIDRLKKQVNGITPYS